MKTEVYCSFCSLPHRAYAKKHVSILEMIAFAAVGILSTHLIWEEFHVAGVLIFVTLTMLMELFHRSCHRHSARCPHCGFDPFIYKAEPAEAARLVKAFLDQRKEDPNYLLRAQPKIKPIIKKVDSKTWAKNIDKHLGR